MHVFPPEGTSLFSDSRFRSSSRSGDPHNKIKTLCKPDTPSPRSSSASGALSSGKLWKLKGKYEKLGKHKKKQTTAGSSYCCSKSMISFVKVTFQKWLNATEGCPLFAGYGSLTTSLPARERERTSWGHLIRWKCQWYVSLVSGSLPFF